VARVGRNGMDGLEMSGDEIEGKNNGEIRNCVPFSN